MPPRKEEAVLVRKLKYETIEEVLEANDRKYRWSLKRRIRVCLNYIRMKIGTAFLGDLLSFYTKHHEDGLVEFRLVDTKRRCYYGPWYIKNDFLGRLILCRSPLYESKKPTYQPPVKPE